MIDPGHSIHTDHAHSVINYPKVGHDGRPITARPFRGVPNREHVTFINRGDILSRVRGYNRWENIPNRYYWHEDYGRRYCHYYDSWGYHWYGWYIGSSYFWVRYYNDYWWWNDADFNRWCYWHDGYWWWRHPTTAIVYIYIDNRYCRYEDRPGGVVLQPENPQPPVGGQPAPPEARETEFYSADGSRLVRVLGDKAEAFLYDSSKEKPVFLAYLSENVKDVQFSDPGSGQPLMINVTVEETRIVDGRQTSVRFFKLFDANGRPFASQLSSSIQDDQSAIQTLQEGLSESAAFRTLEAGLLNW